MPRSTGIDARCYVDGKALWRDPYKHEAPFVECKEHPDAAPIPWTWSEVWEMEYLSRRVYTDGGDDLDGFAATYDETYWPGVSRPGMTSALANARRWHWVEDWLVERERMKTEKTRRALYG